MAPEKWHKQLSKIMTDSATICRGDCILHCCVRLSLLFPFFLPFWYPYILLHFKCFLLLVYVIFFGSRRMFELQFAAEVSDLTGTWAVGVLALVYHGQYYSGITLPALAEESGPGISSQLLDG